MPLLASDIWRDFETTGVPASGAHKPIKADIRAWGSALENAGGITAPGAQLVPLFSNGVGVPAAYRPIVGNDLPNPSLAVPGAVYAKPAVAGQILAGLGTDGEFDTVDTSALVISGLTAPVKVNGLNFLNSSGGSHMVVAPDGRDGISLGGSPANNLYKAALHQWYNPTASQLFAELDSIGSRITPQPLTNTTPNTNNALRITQTWNNGTTVNNLVDLLLTDTASSSGSRLIRAVVGGTLKWMVDKAGSGTYAGNLNIGGVIVVGTKNFASFNGANMDRYNVPAGTRWLNDAGAVQLEILTNAGARQYYGSSSGFHSVAPPAVASGSSTWPTTSGELLNTGKGVTYKVVQAGVNVNAAGTDNATTLPLVPGVTRWRVASVQAINTGATASLTTATIGFFSAAGGGGTTYVASSSLSAITSNTPNTPGIIAGIGVGTLSSVIWNSGATIYARNVVAQGASAAVDLIWQIEGFP